MLKIRSINFYSVTREIKVIEIRVYNIVIRQLEKLFTQANSKYLNNGHTL